MVPQAAHRSRTNSNTVRGHDLQRIARASGVFGQKHDNVLESGLEADRAPPAWPFDRLLPEERGPLIAGPLQASSEVPGILRHSLLGNIQGR